jgi:hypothetical protein
MLPLNDLCAELSSLFTSTSPLLHFTIRSKLLVKLPAKMASSASPNPIEPVQEPAADPPVPATEATETSHTAPIIPPGEHDNSPAEVLAVSQQAAGIIEAGPADSSSDAGYETDGASAASTSLSSSVRNYAFENGRRYHKFREGAYQFPNDEPEQAREDMKHAMIVNLSGGKLHFAPLENLEGGVQSVLDVGTGTGIWCIDSEC